MTSRLSKSRSPSRARSPSRSQPEGATIYVTDRTLNRLRLYARENQFRSKGNTLTWVEKFYQKCHEYRIDPWNAYTGANGQLPFDQDPQASEYVKLDVGNVDDPDIDVGHIVPISRNRWIMRTGDSSLIEYGTQSTNPTWATVQSTIGQVDFPPHSRPHSMNWIEPTLLPPLDPATTPSLSPASFSAYSDMEMGGFYSVQRNDRSDGDDSDTPKWNVHMTEYPFAHPDPRTDALSLLIQRTEPGDEPSDEDRDWVERPDASSRGWLNVFVMPNRQWLVGVNMSGDFPLVIAYPLETGDASHRAREPVVLDLPADHKQVDWPGHGSLEVLMSFNSARNELAVFWPIMRRAYSYDAATFRLTLASTRLPSLDKLHAMEKFRHHQMVVYDRTLYFARGLNIDALSLDDSHPMITIPHGMPILQILYDPFRDALCVSSSDVLEWYPKSVSVDRVEAKDEKRENGNSGRPSKPRSPSRARSPSRSQPAASLTSASVQVPTQPSTYGSLEVSDRALHRLRLYIEEGGYKASGNTVTWLTGTSDKVYSKWAEQWSAYKGASGSIPFDQDPVARDYVSFDVHESEDDNVTISGAIPRSRSRWMVSFNDLTFCEYDVASNQQNPHPKLATRLSSASVAYASTDPQSVQWTLPGPNPSSAQRVYSAYSGPESGAFYSLRPTSENEWHVETRGYPFADPNTSEDELYVPIQEPKRNHSKEEEDEDEDEDEEGEDEAKETQTVDRPGRPDTGYKRVFVVPNHRWLVGVYSQKDVPFIVGYPLQVDRSSPSGGSSPPGPVALGLAPDHEDADWPRIVDNTKVAITYNAPNDEVAVFWPEIGRLYSYDATTLKMTASFNTLPRFKDKDLGAPFDNRHMVVYEKTVYLALYARIHVFSLDASHPTIIIPHGINIKQLVYDPYRDALAVVTRKGIEWYPRSSSLSSSSSAPSMPSRQTSVIRSPSRSPTTRSRTRSATRSSSPRRARTSSALSSSPARGMSSVDGKASSPESAGLVIALRASTRTILDSTTRVALVSVFRSIDGSQQEHRLVHSSYVAVPLRTLRYRELLDAAFSGTAWIRSSSRVLGQLLWPTDKPVLTWGECLAMNEKLQTHGISVQVTHFVAPGSAGESPLVAELLDAVRRQIC